MTRTHIELQLPHWCDVYLVKIGQPYTTLTSRMEFVLNLAEMNVHNGGGPFGAAVFDHSGILTSIGINLVTSTNCSVLHAEIVALIMAEKKLHNYDISDHGHRDFELVTSCEPCTMCLGAVIWAGVHSLVCGARDEDARAIGFDEGPKPDNLFEELHKRHIKITRDVLRADAINILKQYQQSGQPIYNAGQKE